MVLTSKRESCSHSLQGKLLTLTEYMMCVTSVDPYWLAELGSVFFSIRERNFDALARAKANREFSKRTELEAEMARQREEYVPGPFFT